MCKNIGSITIHNVDDTPRNHQFLTISPIMIRLMRPQNQSFFNPSIRFSVFFQHIEITTDNDISQTSQFYQSDIFTFQFFFVFRKIKRRIKTFIQKHRNHNHFLQAQPQSIYTTPPNSPNPPKRICKIFNKI